MATDIIGLIQAVEDDSYDGKAFKKVTINGIVYRVKQGKEGALMAKWGLLVTGTAIKLIMKDFMKEGKAYPFVHDIETVEGALPEPTSSAVPPPPRTGELDTKLMSMAFSYMKDIVGFEYQAGIRKTEMDMPALVAMANNAGFIYNVVKGDFIVETK